jgi:hypothetical protein
MCGVLAKYRDFTTRRTVAVEDDPLAEAMRFLLDAQSSVQEISL